jgi:hypothetical protein
MPNKYDEAITKLEALRASIDEELAVVRADAVADRDKDKGNDDGKNNANEYKPPSSSNPFFKMRLADGSVDKAVEKRIGDMITTMGHKRVADIARAAKSPAAPLGLSLTGLPLKS